MIAPATSRLWLGRASYLGLAALILFWRLLPISTSPARLPGPDLMLGLTLAWVLRRPDHLPALSIVAVFLLEDMLALRPPGLWPVLVLLGSEFLRDRIAVMRGLPFLAEWATVTAVMAAMMLAQRLIFGVTFVPQLGLGLGLMQLLTTALAYPAIVGLTVLVFGRHPVEPGRGRLV